MILVKTLMSDFDVVDEADEEIRFQRPDLIEVEGTEESVMPSERRVGVHGDVSMFFDRPGGRNDVLEGCSPERVQATDRKIEDVAGSNVLRFGVHHVADVKDIDLFAPFTREGGSAVEVGLLINADLSGDDGSPAWAPNAWRNPSKSRFRGRSTV